MALITRVARLFRADLHAVLDRLEEPETLLRQALREMEDAQSANARRLKLLEQAEAHAAGREADLRESVAAGEGRLAAALQAGQDDLARAVIRRRLEAEQALKILSRRRAELASNRAELAEGVRENGVRLEAMRQKVEVLAEQEAAAGAGRVWEDLGAAVDTGVQSADVELALLAARQAHAASAGGGERS